MPRAAASRARASQLRADAAGFAGTVTLPLPPATGERQAIGVTDIFDAAFSGRIAPCVIKANRQACKSIACPDNIPGSATSDDRLSNVRPACCQAAIDIDEPMYALSKIFSVGEHDAAHGHHAHGAPCAAERWMAIGTAVAAGVGVWYGLRNFTASKQTGRVLGRMGQRVAQRLEVAKARRAVGPRPLPERQALRNDGARIRCLARAKATHHFSMWHGGVLQIANGGLLLASVALPALAPVATLGMVVFCGAQARRFVMARRASTLPTQALRVDATEEKMAPEGMRLLKQRLTDRRRAFVQGAWAHGTYGVGAGLLTLATVVSGAGVLLWPGLVCLILGMLAVATTSKSSADHTFTSNSDADLGTETLGGKASMLRQLALLTHEGTAARAVAAGLPSTDTRWHRLGRAAVESLGAGCGFEERAQIWSRRKRVASVQTPNTRWLAACIAEVGHMRMTTLQEETAALGAKAARSKHPSDAAALQNTQHLLGQWRRTEERWTQACAHGTQDVSGDAFDEASGMAEMALSWLISRRWQEEVLSSLYMCTPDGERQRHVWWEVTAGVEPKFNAPLWLERLNRNDEQAQQVWRLLQAVIADFLVHRQVDVTGDRTDALVNHLVERLSTSEPKA